MNELPRCVVGLTGLPSSGKGEVSNALLALARESGWKVEHLSFSDRIKEEAAQRSIPEERFDRELLSQIGTEMRQTEGPGVLSARLVQMIEAWPEPRPDMFVVEALRHTGEVDVMRDAFGERFVLIAVEAEPREIARRLIARSRPDESPDALKSEAHAVELLERELNGHLSDLGPNVGQCLERADVRFPNHGTLDDLRRTVKEFFESLRDRTASAPDNG